MKNNQDFLNLLRKIKKNPSFSQRKLADELGFSLGKLNYCLKALKSKGLIKMENFKRNPNKLNENHWQNYKIFFFFLSANDIYGKNIYK